MIEPAFDAAGIPFEPACDNCRWYGPGRVCAVFGTAPPLPILSGEWDHRLRFPGDGGRGWEPDDAHAPASLVRAREKAGR